jgi:CRISPR-associated endonuclease/helicase Cas3
LVAAHHGNARPHFRPEFVVDPAPKSADLQQLANESVVRFGRLQQRYGPWGLAYVESLLRAADYAASAEPTRYISVDQ